ncbi:MAG: hypothetical protein IPK14_17535 [Blastocatellia bacterium]|nr:hypothetical protein [Blastocatellia bacterium]MBL8192432.1 hypothetical protein [Blastocatellia bacterium]MBN8722533.1 hypothetical protein [Acidobacteriota bacterium]
MSYPCLRCGRTTINPNEFCRNCVSQDKTQKILIFGAVLAILVLGAIALLVFQATLSSSPTVTLVNTPTPIAITPIATQTPVTNISSSTNTSPKTELITTYSATMQPIMSDVRAEMTATVLDIKDFLKSINAIKDSKDNKEVRRIIDNFREQMKKHSAKLVTLNTSLRSIAPPSQLESKQESLSIAINKYNGAVQGYIQGLAAYNFQQIRVSQTQLEQADKEVLTVMVELQEIFTENSK